MLDILIPQMCDLYGPVLEWRGILTLNGSDVYYPLVINILVFQVLRR